jgi:DNA ligase-associated metallophosphoesterase
MSGFAFAGQDFLIADRTALYWPAERALVVADLHLEKASWFAERGQMLPPYDSQATLERLGHILRATGAGQVWCLGDNFHDDAGPMRMTPPARALLARLTDAVDWYWITGNHDAHLPEGIGGTVRADARVRGLALRHEADPAEPGPELSGHYHPKVRAIARGRGVTRPCFVRSSLRLILPSFGALTGGLDARSPAVRAIVGADADAIVESGGRALVLPLCAAPKRV